MKKETRKVGRPTKYNSKTVERVYDFVKEQEALGVPPFIERLAYKLEVDTDTIVEWQKKHKEFSVAIKRLKNMQAAMLQEIVAEGKVRPAGGIFLLKNNHGFRDKQEIDHTTQGEKLPTPIYGGKSVNESRD